MASREQFDAALTTVYQTLRLADDIRKLSASAMEIGFRTDAEGNEQAEGVSRVFFASKFHQLGQMLEKADEAICEVGAELSKLNRHRVEEGGLIDHSFHHLCLQWSKLVWKRAAGRSPAGMMLIFRFLAGAQSADSNGNPLLPTWVLPEADALRQAEQLAEGCSAVSAIDLRAMKVEIEKEYDLATVGLDIAPQGGSTGRPHELPPLTCSQADLAWLEDRTNRGGFADDLQSRGRIYYEREQTSGRKIAKLLIWYTLKAEHQEKAEKLRRR